MSRKTGAIVTSGCRLPRPFRLEGDRAQRFATRARAKGETATAGALVLGPDRRKALPRAENPWSRIHFPPKQRSHYRA
jgi:hypothetical protein